MIENFNFPFCVWLGVKSGEMKKVNLYKFTYMPLLKNDAQLKQKIVKKREKKVITQIYYKKKEKKNHFYISKRKEKKRRIMTTAKKA